MKRKILICGFVLILSSLACNFLSPVNEITESVGVEDQVIVVEGDSITLQGMQGGRLATPDGVELIFPPGSLTTDLNEIVRVQVSARMEADTISSENYVRVGKVYQIENNIGADMFEQPVQLSLPIPPEIDVEEIIGLMTYDENSQEWLIVPAYVDEATGQVSASVQNFSGWSIASIGNVSFHCSLYHVGPQCYPQEKGAWLEVSNFHRFERNISPALPNARYNQYTVNYGVCIVAHRFDNPNETRAWTPPSGWCMTASDFLAHLTGRFPASGRWLLPAGEYELMEVAFASDRNPLESSYKPAYSKNQRSLGKFEMRDGQTYEFSNSGNFSDWQGWGVSSSVHRQDEIPMTESQDWPSDWVGSWQAAITILERSCSDSCEAVIDDDAQTRISNVTSFMQNRPFIIPANYSELQEYVDSLNQDIDVEAAREIDLNYPNFRMYNPSVDVAQGDGSFTRYVGILYEGTYSPETDSFSGNFEFWWDFSGEVFRGTWYGERIE